MYLYCFCRLTIHQIYRIVKRKLLKFMVRPILFLTESWSDESSDLQFHGQTDSLFDRIDAQHLDTDHIPYADRL